MTLILIDGSEKVVGRKRGVAVHGSVTEIQVAKVAHAGAVLKVVGALEARLKLSVAGARVGAVGLSAAATAL